MTIRRTAIIAAMFVATSSIPSLADSFEEKDGVTYFLSDSTHTAEAMGTTRNEGNVNIASTVSIEVADPKNPEKKITKTYTVTRVSGFSGKGINSVSIPATVTEIGKFAFQSCTELKSVNLPAALRSLGSSAFSGCSSISAVSIPVGCTLGDYAFNGCTSLKTASTTGVDSIGNAAFMGCTSLIQGINLPRKSGEGIYSQCTSLKDKPITENGIPDRTFQGCKSLNVREIRMLDGAKIGVGAFSGCTSITEIYIDGAPVGIGAFDGCTSLTKVEFGEKVSQIGVSAFYNCPLKTVICNSATPPTAYDSGIAGSAFSSLHYSSATLYVPANWINVYAATQPWKNFFSIKAIAAGVDNPTAEKIKVVAANGKLQVSGVDSAESIDVFNATGALAMRVTAARLGNQQFPAGVYVVRCKGISSKVVL